MSKYNFDIDLTNRNSIALIVNLIQPNSKILEFGCAHGRLTKHLKEKMNCKVTIVEIDEEAGKEAGKYAQNAFLGQEQGDIEKYYWKECLEERFDYIIFADVLEHLYAPQKVLIESQKLLAKKGQIIVSIPNVAHNSVLIDLLNDDFKYRKLGILDDTHIRFFTRKSFKRMINEIQTLEIKTELATYAEVGESEIENSYDDMSRYLKLGLKQNKVGNIYQYVFSMINRQEGTEEGRYIDIAGYVPYEMTLFWKCQEKEFEEERSLKYRYSLNGLEGELIIPECEKVTEFRIDPFEVNGIIRVKYLIGYTKDGSTIRLEVIRSNAQYSTDSYYFFKDNDPWIIASTGNNDIRKLGFAIDIIDCELQKDTEASLTHFIEQEFVLKDTHIKNIEYDQSLKSEQIKVLETSLKLKDNHIKNIEHDQSVQSEQITMLEKNLKLKNNHISNIEHNQDAQSEQIEILKTNLQLKDNHISNVEHNHEIQSEQIKMLVADLQFKDNHISNIELDLVQCRKAIHDLRTLLESKENIIEDYREMCNQKEVENSQLTVLNNTLQKQIYELTKQVQDQQIELQHIYESKIYRLLNGKIGRKSR